MDERTPEQVLKQQVERFLEIKGLERKIAQVKDEITEDNGVLQPWYRAHAAKTPFVAVKGYFESSYTEEVAALFVAHGHNGYFVELVATASKDALRAWPETPKPQATKSIPCLCWTVGHEFCNALVHAPQPEPGFEEECSNNDGCRCHKHAGSVVGGDVVEASAL